MSGHIVTFLGISALIIVMPGPDTALTIRNAVVGGRAGGLFTTFGVVSGQATWAAFTAAGVAALLRESQPAFLAVRIAGVCYLIYLGVRALMSALRAQTTYRHGGDIRRMSRTSAYRQGLLSNLSNPKMVVFFISLLPQFNANPSFSTLALFGLVFCTMTLLWLSAYAVLVARAGDLLRRTRVRRGLDALTGFALVGLGIRLAVERT